MIQQLSSLSDWLPISFIPTASQLLEKEVVKKMALLLTLFGFQVPRYGEWVLGIILKVSG